ncbi:MAG: DNA replication/repair protein RecF [Lachnospiraceae bacterium]|nr:DNA replication/repair protein RecF [Lachnospiraceae bacterium]
MIIKSLELENFRNYDTLHIDFDKGVNIFYGDNAQGKTNILEAVYMSATTRSHKGSKDKDIINFKAEEAHIKTILDKEGLERRVDMHLRKARSKGIAVDKVRLKKATELLGLLNIVLFSPEDMAIIKNAPSERRRFVDMELCQLDEIYLYDLNNYNKIVNQRNKLLKDIYFHPDYRDMIKIWDAQLLSYGVRIIKRRKEFTDRLNEIIEDIHAGLSGGREKLKIIYAPHVKAEEYEEKLKASVEKDIRLKMTSTGPHRDDFVFISNGTDIRVFGSQGQQRTAALSLKLSEIELVKKTAKDEPVLLLDDVLSELDANRQNHLLNNIGGIQTIITCTGLDDFVNNRFKYDKVFKVENGTVRSEN